jgi:hypothetical protein
MGKPDPVGDKILDLFRHRCIGLIPECSGRAVCVHEITPKSLEPDWSNPRGRVPLCNNCHTWLHHEVDPVDTADYVRERQWFLMEQLEISEGDLKGCADEKST